jgi:Concanavalin A-like lectin/glucanases superfamily
LGSLFHKDLEMSELLHQSRRGSIYLITLITVAAIVSTIFIGFSLRSASNSNSALIGLTVESGMGILDSTEIALEHVTADSLFRVNAQTGTVYGPVVVDKDGNTLTSTVVDAATDLNPTFDTTTYRLKMNSTNDIANANAQVDVLAIPYDYITYLDKLSLIHYWPLNEHSNPTTAVDQKSNYDGTYQDPSVAASSYNEEGAPVPVFDRSGDHIEVPYGNGFSQREGAFSLWINLASNDKTNHAIIGNLYESGGVPAFNLAINGNAVWAYLDDGGSWDISSALSTSSNSITVGQWHHIVVSWGSLGLTIYIDGVRRAKNSSNRDELSSAMANNGGEQPFHIGGGYNMFLYPPPEDRFRGSVAHVALFKKQPTDDHVASLAEVMPDLRTYELVEDSWVRVFD